MPKVLRSKPKNQKPIVHYRKDSPQRRSSAIAIDTETTGPDFFHGCRPFFVSIFTDEDDILDWRWDVDPTTRKVLVPKSDVRAIQRKISTPGVTLIFHNWKFDCKALESIGIEMPDCSHIEDTMVASHAYNSLEPHGLKDLALKYLDIGDDDERELKEVVEKCRDFARTKGWMIAEKGNPTFPALAKAEWWKLDMWLPWAVADYLELPDNHLYRTVCARYGRLDPVRTFGLWNVYREALHEEELYEVYRKRIELSEVTKQMEAWGVTGNPSSMHFHANKFADIKTAKAAALSDLSNGTIKNPNSPKQVQNVIFGQYKYPIIKMGDNGPSTAKDVIERLLELPDDEVSPGGREFLGHLVDYRKVKKCVEYLHSYLSAGIPITTERSLLHPDFNVCGTRTTRFSSTNPNAQNISKQKAYNLRRCFGPAHGRVWFAPDYSNIELRIFAYRSGDQRLIDAFEAGFSVHLIFAQILHPREYEQCLKDGVPFNDRYKDTLYQNTKNGNFSLIYGASERKADATYKVKGAYGLIRRHLPLIDGFIRETYREGRAFGYVTLLGGYRLRVPRKDPHKACNYFIQGSAGWAISLALIRIFRYLRTLGDAYKIIMQVHDELVFDFPRHPRNLNIMRRIVQIMEQSGDDIGVPLKVETDRILNNWAEGEDITPLLATAA